MEKNNVFKVALKFLGSITLLSLLIAGSFIISIIIRNKRKRYRLLCNYKCFLGRIMKRIMQVRILDENKETFTDSRKNFLIICNHLTYLDTFIMSEVFPAVFIANAGLKKNFFVYALNKSIGNIFVERQRGSQMLKEIKKVTDALQSGVNIILFPEGTTSDGKTILPFRAPFIKSAVDAKKDILPVCIKYTEMNGKAMTVQGLQSLIYRGHMNIFTHLFRVCENQKIVVKVKLLDVIQVSSVASRKILVDKAYQSISKEFSGKGV